MNKIISFFIVMIFISKCFTTRPEVIEAPKDYSEVVEEVEESKELESKPELKKKVVQAIKSQSEYSTRCYEQLKDFDERLSKLEKDNQELRKENYELKKEIYAYRLKELGFYIGIGLIALGLLIRAFWPVLKPLFLRAVGLPV